MVFRAVCLFVILCLYSVQCQECNQNSVPGQCTLLGNCPSALSNPKGRSRLKKCGFKGVEPIICCTDPQVVGNYAATPSPIQSKKPFVPEEVEYRDNSGADTCPPNKLTAPKNGRKAFDKCIEYQEQLIYPCERGVDILGLLSRSNNCNHMAEELILGGTDAKRGEFPHMALIGYGESAAAAEYMCGGSVISEKFILTAGHCTKSARETYVKVGVLKRTESVPESRLHAIRRVFKHPDFHPPAKYNDIALLETVTTIKLDLTTVPACLGLGEDAPAPRALASGWGDQEGYRASRSDTLQKVTLERFSYEECDRVFRRGERAWRQGVDRNTQLCFGHHTEEKDTCQGDSGGPLQIYNKRIHCMYTIIGVSSFGRNCGEGRKPAVYIKVAPYVPWIESIVWP